MKHLLYSILMLLCVVRLTSCGNDNEDEPIVKEQFSAFITTPYNGEVGSVIFEETSAEVIAQWIPCEITKDTIEKTIIKGGSETTEYSLTLYKWKDADYSWVTTNTKDYEVFSAVNTTYTFTPGIYDFEVDDYPRSLCVKEDGIYILNPSNHEEVRKLYDLEDCKRTYQVLSETPLRKYSEKESSTYAKKFSLTKLAEDHFYIENEDYTFEGYITAKGVNLFEIKPEEKEIGLLYR